ncbi:MAG TPA: hypothetical protein VFZ27_12180 [Terriglobia bacterium]|nr:hypothetical protein [Terriglobia bacterium]
MCDYSLMGVPNRLVRANEELVLYRFHTGTLGFTSVAEESGCQQTRSFWQRLKRNSFSAVASSPTAVCIPPGARLRLEDVPRNLQTQLQVGETAQATFTQLSVEPHRHRDAVRFDNGIVAKLQNLRPGMRAKVLDLSLAEASEPVLSDPVEAREVYPWG